MQNNNFFINKLFFFTFGNDFFFFSFCYYVKYVYTEKNEMSATANCS